MAKLVKQIYDLILLATDKGITGYWSDSQVMDAIDQAQMGLFRPLISQFAETKKIRNELLPFQVQSNIPITNKIGTIPIDFEHEREAWVTSQNVDYMVDIVEDGIFRRRLNDPIIKPTTDLTNLIANIYNNAGKKIELSAQITPLVFRYFKRPIKPVYATTLVSGQYQYDDTNSVDVEWSPIMHDVLVERSLGILGLSIRDGQVQRAGQLVEPKEVSTR